MLTSIIIPLTISCGGDDKNENIEIEPPIEVPNAISDLCKMFGINADDYYDYWRPYSKDDKIVISLANKNSNKLFVAVYDTNKKSVVYTNSDIPFTTKITTSYYDESFEGKIVTVYPIFAETKNGFIIDVIIGYNKTGDILDFNTLCINNLYFFDGVTSNTKQIPASSTYFDEIIFWHDNSCILDGHLSGVHYWCYTDKGEEVFTDKYIESGDNYTISYNEYININKYNKIQFKRLDILNPEKNGIKGHVWSKEIKLVDNYSSDLKVEHTIEDRTSSVWSFSSKFVWEDGTTKVVKWQLNIENGDYIIK